MEPSSSTHTRPFFIDNESLSHVFTVLSLKLQDKLRRLDPQLKKEWEEILITLQQQSSLFEFEREVMGRLPEEILSHLEFINRLKTILKKGSLATSIFLKLATTHHFAYYQESELLDLTANCIELLNMAEQAHHSISLIGLSQYNVGGKQWLEKSIQRFRDHARASQEKKRVFFRVKNFFKKLNSIGAPTPIPTPVPYQPFSEYAEKLILKNKLSHNDSTHLTMIWKKLTANSAASTPEQNVVFFKRFNKIKSTLGAEIFTLVSNPKSYDESSTIETTFALLQNLIEIKSERELTQPILKKFYKNEISSAEALKQIQDYTLKQNQFISKERDLSLLVRAFQGKENNSLVHFPLADEELTKIYSEYQQVVIEEQKLQGKGIRYLAQMAGIIRKRCQDRRQGQKINISDKDKLTLIAIARQAFHLQFGIYPYHTQIFILLALLNYPSRCKGRIAQVKTGEGKSTIITLLALYQACQGYFVDIVTSSRYLAERDCKKYSGLFRLFQITTSHICVDHPQKENFAGQIIFGTQSDFQFSIMRDAIFNLKLRTIQRDGRLEPRPFEAVIVDEVDSLFMDSALSCAQIAIPSPIHLNWIYQPVLEFVKSKTHSRPDAFNAQSFTESFTESLMEELRKHLSATHSQECTQYASSLTDRQLKAWLSSAYQALYNKKEDIDYVIKPSTRLYSEDQLAITIVDKENTGRLQEGSRWSEGIHEFLEAKHHLPIQSESLIPASLSNPIYFNSYLSIYGLTGTIGEDIERKELQLVYQVDTFDAPPHRPNQREIYPTKIVKGQDAFLPALQTEIDWARQKNRPVLVLFKTIEESEHFNTYLNSLNIPHSILNERQATEENFIIAQAGLPGKVLIATNTAGRGTDIPIHPVSLQNGGLHVIFTFYPENTRVEMQGFGRAGRQGQPGSGRMVLLATQSIENQLQDSDNVTEQFLFQKRLSKIHLLSISRLTKVEFEQLKNHYLNVFYQQLNQWREQVGAFSFQDIKQGLIECIKTNENCRKRQLTAPLFIIFKKQIETKIIQNWSFYFYNKLSALSKDAMKTEDGIGTKTNEQGHISKLFEEHKNKWEAYLLEPRESIIKYIQEQLDILENG